MYLRKVRQNKLQIFEYLLFGFPWRLIFPRKILKHNKRDKMNISVGGILDQASLPLFTIFYVSPGSYEGQTIFYHSYPRKMRETVK